MGVANELVRLYAPPKCVAIYIFLQKYKICYMKVIAEVQEMIGTAPFHWDPHMRLDDDFYLQQV